MQLLSGQQKKQTSGFIHILSEALKVSDDGEADRAKEEPAAWLLLRGLPGEEVPEGPGSGFHLNSFILKWMHLLWLQCLKGGFDLEHCGFIKWLTEGKI